MVIQNHFPKPDHSMYMCVCVCVFVSIWCGEAAYNVTKHIAYLRSVSIIEYDDMRRTLHFNRKFYQLSVNTSADKGHTNTQSTPRIC